MTENKGFGSLEKVVEEFDGFRKEQVAELSKKLDVRHVRKRQGGGGMQLSYIEGHHAIREANRIFGFGQWDRRTDDLVLVHEGERETGNGKRYSVSYVAKCEITVQVPDAKEPIVRQGYGSGHGFSKNPGEAHESAVKEAETDAMKRALMTFGNSFGLALYDKDQGEVEFEVYEYDLPEPKDGSSPDQVAAFVASEGGRIEGDKVKSAKPIRKLEERKIEMSAKALEVTNNGK